MCGGRRTAGAGVRSENLWSPERRLERDRIQSRVWQLCPGAVIRSPPCHLRVMSSGKMSQDRSNRHKRRVHLTFMSGHMAGTCKEPSEILRRPRAAATLHRFPIDNELGLQRNLTCRTSWCSSVTSPTAALCSRCPPPRPSDNVFVRRTHLCSARLNTRATALHVSPRENEQLLLGERNGFLVEISRTVSSFRLFPFVCIQSWITFTFTVSLALIEKRPRTIRPVSYSISYRPWRGASLFYSQLPYYA